MAKTGSVVSPELKDPQRVHRVSLPPKPAVGEVVGLAVSGDQGVILRFEMQATKGFGRIIPPGSIQRVMHESIEAAAQYVIAPQDNLAEAQTLPAYILDAVKLTPVTQIDEVLKKALGGL